MSFGGATNKVRKPFCSGSWREFLFMQPGFEVTGRMREEVLEI